MASYTATITWERDGATFTDHKYSRLHRLSFDGGINVPGSSSPHVVREPMSVPDAVDPEELFVASRSSCHMLWFLDIASRRATDARGINCDASCGVRGVLHRAVGDDGGEMRAGVRCALMAARCKVSSPRTGGGH